MSDYNLLFSITINHLYFANGQPNDIYLQPDPPTQKLLDDLNMKFEQTDAGWNVYYDESAFQPGKLLAYAEKKLSFMLYSYDECFLNYTLLPPYTNNQVCYFTNINRAAKTGSASLPLTADAKAGAGDVYELISPSLTCAYTVNKKKSTLVLTDPTEHTIFPSSSDASGSFYTNLNGAYTLKQSSTQRKLYANMFAYKTKPSAVIDIYLDQTQVNNSYSVFNKGRVTTKNYNIVFDSRSAKWRYYVINKTNTKVDNLSVASSDNKIMFVSKGAITMLGFPAYVLESKSAIKMQEYPNVNMKLALNSSNGNTSMDYILIPSAESLKTENKTNFIDAYIYI
ncbi:MAG TPA: hypothetical protein VGF30_15375 [Bacteroidia bacterium]